MKLNPRQAPLYGSCVLTVQLDDEELCEEEDVELFLLFTGSTQRHISSTLRVGHDTLRAVCPAHDCCESVVVSLCSAGPGDHVRLLSSDVVRFSFIQDLAFDMAQFLVGAAGRTDTLEEALLLDEHQIPLQECEKMDQSLALALSHLTLPPGWSLLGSSSTAEPQETLLHFAARRGLHRVVRFLLKQPGAKEALTLPNKQGSTATSLAESRGHQALLALLTREETGTQHSNETHRQICSAPWVVQHHPSLNTYTLSAGTGPGTEPRSLQEDVQDFRRLVLEHSRGEGGAVRQFQSEHADGPEPCSEPPQPSTLDTGEPSSSPPCAKANTVEDVGCAEPLVPRSEGDGDPCSNSAAPAPSSDNGDDDERRACSCENTDCSGENVAACVEGTEQLGDSSDGSQSRPEAEKTACRSTSCGKEPEETDRAQDLICEAQGSAEGPNGEAQEEECSSAKTGRDEEPAQDKELSELGTTAEDMGITQSLDALESSDLDSLSQGSEESSDKVEDGVSEAEEETDGVSEELVATNAEMDQTSCENSETCTSLSCVVDTEISLEDIQEVAFQISGQETEQLEFEVESNEPEHSIKDKAEGQTQDGQMDLTESSPVQACHNDKGSDQPSQNRDIENNTVEEANEHPTISNTDADQAQGCGSVEQSDSSLVMLNATTESSSHLLEQPEESVNQEQVTTREPELVEESATTGGSESEGLGFESSADVLQLEITSLSESPTLTSEDTLEPEEHESSEIPQEVSCDDQEQDALCDLQQLEEDQTLLVTSSEGPENSKPPERHDSLESRAVEVILKYEDAQQTAEMEAIPPECSESVPEADGGATSQNSEADQSEEKVEFVETETTKSCQTDTEEEVKALDDDVVVSDSVSVSLDAENIAEISLSVEEPSSVDEVRNMDVSQPDVMDTDSEDTGLGDAQSTKKAEDEEQTSGVEASLEDQEDFQTEKCPEVSTDNEQVPTIHRERDSLCVDSTQDSTLGGPPEKRQSSESAETPQSQVRHSTGSATLRDSGSDTDGFLSTDTGEDNVFRKADEAIGAGDSTSEVSVSCSSTDDTASLGHPSSSAESSEEARRGEGGGGNVGGEAEEEAKDLLTEVPRRSSVLRSTVRSLSPFRRHSWGPGKNQGAEGDMNQRSSVRSVVGDKKPVFHRRSLSWCPTEPPFGSDLDEISQLLSYSLEGLAAERDDGKGWRAQSGGPSHGQRGGRVQRGDDRGSQVSLNEAGLESDLGDQSSLDSQKSRRFRSIRRNCPSMTLPLRESVSMLSISNRDIDAVGRTRRKRRISFTFNISPMLQKSKTDCALSSSSSDEEDSISMKSFTSTSSSLGYSITEEEPGPLRGDFEGKSGTKMSRTFSYLKNKMYKKTREKDKEKSREKDGKDKEKKAVNGHLFSPVISLPSTLCQHCNKALGSKEAVSCAGCNVCVHKSCRENIPSCSKTKQFLIPESTTMPGVTLRTKTCSMPRERPWSAVLSPDDLPTVTAPRRHTSIMPFNNSNLSKSVSISNISVFDEMSIKGFKYLSQSTDSLHKANKVNESTESLIDEGTELNDGQLMAEFEPDAKELEADSWSFTVDKKYLKQLKKDAIKKQDVIYELIQTEFHHVRTLRIMADVYSKGLLKEVQLETQTVEKIFPVLDELLELHTRFLHGLLERKREAKQEGSDGGFVISRIGDLLMGQFSGTKAENLKKVYGKFCSRHNEAVNLYKELHAKDKRFQTFIRKKMSSSVVRRLGIPECILLVTQRITKYPVLMQRILQHTKENDEDYEDLAQALQLVKEVIAAVDSKVNEHEKRRRLKDIYSRTDGKSIMRMKSGQMFAREDLIRGRKLLHDGPLQLKTSTGRLKDVQALLLSDVLVFLQEKDQKYVFASLDQRATVISLQKLIVREVANEDRGLFLIAAGIERPEMVEVHACSRDERNTWIQLIHDAMQSIEKDEDEGIPSETEEDKRLLESKAKKMRDMLQRKDDQIVALLLEKMKLFHDMCESDENGSASKMLFRACSDDKGEPIMKQAIKEVEMLQTLVSSSLGGAVGQQVVSAPGNISANAANVSLPRRAETFGGFDSHQMNISKTGDKEEGEDLRRTESDGVLKKGGNTNLQHLLKRNREQVLTSVTHLHDLLNSLQAVVLQQDTAIEDQRQSLSERPSSRPPSRPSSRPPSLVEQEKQRSLERQRQEAAALQRQQNAHAEERRRREREWEAREKELAERELLLHSKEEEAQKSWQELEEARRELAGRKDDYQKDLERLRDSQRRLERDREQVQREMETLECLRETEKRVNRTPSSTSEDSLNVQSPGSLERDATETELSSSPRKNSLTRIDSKHKGRNLNPFSLGPKALSTEAQKQMPSRLLQLTRTKDKKEKKKKKSKSKAAQEAESHLLPLTEPPLDGEIFFC